MEICRGWLIDNHLGGDQHCWSWGRDLKQLPLRRLTLLILGRGINDHLWGNQHCWYWGDWQSPLRWLSLRQSTLDPQGDWWLPLRKSTLLILGDQWSPLRQLPLRQSTLLILGDWWLPLRISPLRQSTWSWGQINKHLWGNQHCWS